MIIRNQDFINMIQIGTKENGNMKFEKTALFVIDMVNGFCKEGVMADARIMNIVPTIQALCEKIENRYFIADTHGESDIEFSAFPRHCVKGEWESEIVEELQPWITSNVIEKNSTNAFHAMKNHPVLDDKEIDTYILTGCCSDICVLQFALTLKTYFNATNQLKKVIVAKNGIETYHAPGHDAKEMNEVAYQLMQAAGIEVVDCIQ